MSFTKAKLITLFMEGNKYNCTNFSISGLRGDPLGFEYLTDVLEISKKIFKNKTSIHTNGLLLNDFSPEYFNRLGLTISLFSFNDNQNQNIMRTNISNEVIINFTKQYLNKLSNKNIKFSKIVLGSESTQQINNYLDNCIDIGLRRIVLRLNYFENINNLPNNLIHIGTVFNNHIYKYKDKLEVTIWNYKESTLKGLYLYPDGTIKNYYSPIKEEIC